MDPNFPGMVDPARLTRFKKTIGSFRDSEQAAVKPALAGGLLLPPMPDIPGGASAREVPVPEWRSLERHPPWISVAGDVLENATPSFCCPATQEHLSGYFRRSYCSEGLFSFSLHFHSAHTGTPLPGNKKRPGSLPAAMGG